MWDRPLFRHAQGHLSHDFDHEEVERGKEGREVGKALHVFTISKKFLEGRGPRKKEGGNHANGVSVCEGNKRLFPRAKCTPVTRTRNAPPPATSLMQVRKLFWNFVRQRACLNR